MLCKGEEVKKDRVDIEKHFFICCSRKLFFNKYKTSSKANMTLRYKLTNEGLQNIPLQFKLYHLNLYYLMQK